MNGLYDDINSMLSEELRTVAELTPAGRAHLAEFIRTSTRVQAGDEKTWDVAQMPLIRKMCDTLVVRFTDEGDVSVAVEDTSLQSVLVGCLRGTSWYSSVNMIEGIAQALQLKT